MTPEIIASLKLFDWQTIIDFSNSLDDFDDGQWRFQKGFIVEKTMEKHSNEPTLKYVGEVHKDFVWSRYGVDIELKSNMSKTMYTKKGKYCKNYSIRLNNSMGTNNRALSAQDVADIIIVVKSDGAFALDRATILANHTSMGDGVIVKVTADQIVPITGPISQKTVYNNTLKSSIMHTIERGIP